MRAGSRCELYCCLRMGGLRLNLARLTLSAPHWKRPGSSSQTGIRRECAYAVFRNLRQRFWHTGLPSSLGSHDRLRELANDVAFGLHQLRIP